jgi:hypothetical protein
MSDKAAMLRLSGAMFKFHDVSSAVIVALMDAIPEEITQDGRIQEAMTRYLEGAAEWQTSVAMFSAQMPAEAS